MTFFDVIDTRISIALFWLSYLFGGFFAVREAIVKLRHKKFEIDTLMIVAALGAGALGNWAEGALLLVLFSLGHALEEYAMGRAKKAIEALADIAPKTAHVLRDGRRVEIKVEEVVVGDVVFIKPNERIPVDGFIIKGSSAVNQAPVTGESLPVDKTAVANLEQSLKSFDRVQKESKLFAGTINGSGVLEVHVTKHSSDTTLARVVRMVAEAQAESSPTQQFTAKIQKYFVPAVLVGVIILLFAYLVIDEPFSSSFYRAMAVLVAASPCALAISTPSAVLSGIARAGRAGVLIKGGAALENLGQVTAIAFDKTGTLTEGKPIVTDVFAFKGFNDSQLLSLASAVEAESDHPLARAVVEGAIKKIPNLKQLKATNVESITGKGIRATIEGKTVIVGKPALFEEEKSSAPSVENKKLISELQASGRTMMVVRFENDYVGMIGIMDKPRASSAQALKELRDTGVKHLVMLSGDNQVVASAVAKEIGLTEAIGDLLPEDKVASIKKLREKWSKVAMVGDGVNDAPALATATVGVAMGAAGSDVALETADVALMTDDLSQLSFAVGLSRKASSIIRQNLWVSLGMVIILIPATLTGLGIGPAVVMHEGSTVIVVINALRLLAYKPSL
ncbi:MAG: heavy metal translocating P-type ATPase [Bdellovibrionota bacterium]